MKNRITVLTLLLISGSILTGLTFDEPKQDESLDLQTIMRLIYADMQIINEGIYTENFKLIEQGAAAINEHPPLSDETRALVKKTLGERMPAFGQYDKLVHDTADSLKVAAAERNMESVLDKYQIIQQGCVSCHASFRNEIIRARSVN
ncbi:cytochrome c [Gracilimonas amylolytica]|uniref:cytochrome c n=1 Tax=Gracilimonas amylolytica TaxID=1749045 RepID=UPI000CD8D2C3|nr:cytochrome c [Gracilimonas amylolytica]